VGLEVVGCCEGFGFLVAESVAELEHMTPHDLKHTAASLAVSAGANVEVLQRVLGHKSAAMTLDTYADLFEDDLGAVADRLNERVLAEGDGDLWSN
jgi:integrase